MRDENDQKELVLGNKQLLSIFFIVIAMLGVAFTLGYMIGRNTANASATGISPASAIQASPAQSPPPTRDAEPSTVVPPVAAPVTPAPATEKMRGTRPAKPYETENSYGADAPGGVPAPMTTAVAGAASYLQVAAMKRADADHMVSVLRDRGFPALVGESPKEGLFRVLVGPYKDTASLVDGKAKLKAAGFDNPLIAR